MKHGESLTSAEIKALVRFGPPTSQVLKEHCLSFHTALCAAKALIKIADDNAVEALAKRVLRSETSGSTCNSVCSVPNPELKKRLTIPLLQVATANPRDAKDIVATLVEMNQGTLYAEQAVWRHAATNNMSALAQYGARALPPLEYLLLRRPHKRGDAEARHRSEPAVRLLAKIGDASHLPMMLRLLRGECLVRAAIHGLRRLLERKSQDASDAVLNDIADLPNEIRQWNHTFERGDCSDVLSTSSVRAIAKQELARRSSSLD